MPRTILAFIFSMGFAVCSMTAFSQISTHHSAQIDRVWQMGSCNCYIFSISLWEYVSDNQMESSQRIHNFKVMNGSECRDLKDPDQLMDMSSTISLKEIDVNSEFFLRPADVESQRQYKDLLTLYPHKDIYQNYTHVSVKTSIFSSENSGNPAVFAISLLRNASGDFEEEEMISEIHFFQENGQVSQ